MKENCHVGLEFKDKTLQVLKDIATSLRILSGRSKYSTDNHSITQRWIGEGKFEYKDRNSKTNE